MSETMRAFAIQEAGQTAVVEKPIPQPGPDEAVVKTTTALVCTSDVHTVKGAIPVEANRTLGHEAVGIVHSLGPAVSGFVIKVAMAPSAVLISVLCSINLTLSFSYPYHPLH